MAIELEFCGAAGEVTGSLYVIRTPEHRILLEGGDVVWLDERTLAVRTTRQRGLDNARRGRWHYIVQEWQDLMERLHTGAYPRSQVMLGDLIAAGPPHHGDEISIMNRELRRRVLERRERRRAARAEDN